MGQRNTDRVVDPGGAAERRIKALAIQIAHQGLADRAGHLPMEVAAGKVPGRLAADMDGERRCHGVKELLRVVVGEDDPQVGFQRCELRADPRRDVAHAGHGCLVLGLRQGEELRGMRQHGATDDG